MEGLKLDCKTVGFFLKISNKEIGKSWHKSLTRVKAREPIGRVR